MPGHVVLPMSSVIPDSSDHPTAVLTPAWTWSQHAAAPACFLFEQELCQQMPYGSSSFVIATHECSKSRFCRLTGAGEADACDYKPLGVLAREGSVASMLSAEVSHESLPDLVGGSRRWGWPVHDLPVQQHTPPA